MQFIHVFLCVIGYFYYSNFGIQVLVCLHYLWHILQSFYYIVYHMYDIVFYCIVL